MADQTLQCHLSQAITLTRPSGEVVHLSQEELGRILQSLVAWGALVVIDPRSQAPYSGDDAVLGSEPGGSWSVRVSPTADAQDRPRPRTPLIPGLRPGQSRHQHP